MPYLKVKTIAVIDDSAADVEFIQEILEGSPVDLKVLTFLDGVEALPYIQRAENGEVPVPDLVLLDLNMPKVHGFQVLQEFRKSKFKHLPVIIFTGSSQQSDIQRAYQEKATAFITKPLDVEDFQNSVLSIVTFWSTWVARHTYGVNE